MVFPPPTTIRILSQLTRSSRSNRVTRVSECWSRSRTVTITRPVPTLFPKPSSHPFSSMAPVDYKSPSYLPSYVAIPPKGEHKATVIFTHGLGDNAKNFAMCVAPKLLESTTLGGVKWIFPSAPVSYVTANDAEMPSWFDITSFDFESRETDEEGILRAAGWIKKIVDKEVNEEKIPPSKIVIGGFSQGGALSFAALLTLGAERKVAGVFGMSTYLPVGDHIHKITTNPNVSSIPLFWGHGKSDPLIRYTMVLPMAKQLATELKIPYHFMEDDTPRLTHELLLKDGLQGLRFRGYRNTPHWMADGALEDLTVWLTAVFAHSEAETAKPKAEADAEKNKVGAVGEKATVGAETEKAKV